MPVEEQDERSIEHVVGFGEPLGASVEAGEVVADGGVLSLDQMRFGFGLDMGDCDAVALEGQPIAGVGIGEDGGDGGDGLAR